MNIMTMMLTKKLAVVTGGTRGIGAAIVAVLKQAGADVMITGTGSTTDVPSQHDYFYSVDFSCQRSTDECAAFLSKKQPDILINNAGINAIDSFEDIKENDFNRIHQVNVAAPFFLCRAVIPGMREKAWGRIVNISSIFGKISKAGRASYSTSKFALDGMTAALAAEVASYGILANCVAPGFIETDLTRKTLGEEKMLEMMQHIPIGRLGRVEEVAKFVGWLVSQENTYISGQNIAIDGGFTRV
jgi:NAD(P)-dependent dehydrogenase (short-subunit alcohol dehydrogenase family)